MAMISNCNDRNNRLQYLEQMMEAGLEIDSFGGCLHNKDPPEGFGRDGSWMVAKQELMKQCVARLTSWVVFVLADLDYFPFFRYKFVIAFENSNSPGYLTEKFWGPLVVGAIPSRIH
jgi:hypothetical protein